jgi:hypothetical protein
MNMGNSYMTTFDKYPKDKLAELTKKGAAAAAVTNTHSKKTA